MANKFEAKSKLGRHVQAVVKLLLILLSFLNPALADSHTKKSNYTDHLAARSLPLDDVKQLQAIEHYLNSFRTLKARFQQLNPNGTLATGTLYLWRPGRMRLAYDQSNGKDISMQRVIVANGDSFFDHNPEMDETTEIPVDATPASFIMRDHIRFIDDIRVIDHRITKGMLAITLVKRDEPDMGSLTLFFNPEPLTLLEWEIVDSQQLRTRVILDAIETGSKFDATLFKVDF